MLVQSKEQSVYESVMRKTIPGEDVSEDGWVEEDVSEDGWVEDGWVVEKEVI